MEVMRSSGIDPENVSVDFRSPNETRFRKYENDTDTFYVIYFNRRKR